MQRHVGPAALGSLILSGIGLSPKAYRRASEEDDATHHCVAATLLGAIVLGLYLSRSISLVPQVLVLVEVVRAMAMLAVQTSIVWILGRWVLRRQQSFASVLRPVALAGAPGVLFALGASPPVETAVGIAGPIWLLAAFVVAIRAALDCTWPQAVALALGVWLVEHAPGALLTLMDAGQGVPSA